jgi:hypothetical protein
MAFNCADTRQRAYNRIDTSAPGGSWIDEKQYNKHIGPAKAGARRTLVGNWQEEGVLEKDMAERGHDLTMLKEVPAAAGPTRFRGGYESTEFLLSSQDRTERAMDGNSTYASTYGETAMNRSLLATSTGDGSGAPPNATTSGGVRSQLKAREVVEEARQMVAQQQQTLLTASRVGTGSDSFTSTYRTTINATAGPQYATRRVIEPANLDGRYVKDVPVTLYTGNPETGAAMVVPGKSGHVGLNPLGRTNAFTFNKYAIGDLKR